MYLIGLFFPGHIAVLKFEDDRVDFMCYDPGFDINNGAAEGAFSFQDLFDTEIIPQETFEVFRQAGDPPIPS